MSNMNKRIRDMVYPVLVLKQGEQCTHCKVDLWMLGELGKQQILVIDHVDNNNSNNAINNLQLLCRSCNTKKNWTRNQTEPTTRNIPLELSRSITNKKKARKYIYGRMDTENYALNYIDLIDDLTEYLGNSQQANKNYVAGLCSKKHGLFTLEDRNGTIFLVPKNESEMDVVVTEFTEDSGE